jgi:FkbM family methyltransferase
MQTVEIMRRVLKPTSNCADVGAAWGGILNDIVALSPQGQHHAFEPLPMFADQLRSRFPHVNVHQFALGDEKGEFDFNYALDNPAYSGLQRRPYPNINERVETLRVAVERLDDVIGSNTRLDFLKIDVEGGEVRVLRGSKATLKRCRPIVVFEHGGEKFVGKQYGTTDDMLFEIFDQANLSVSTLDAWLDSGPPLQRSEFPVSLGDGRWHWMYIAHPST